MNGFLKSKLVMTLAVLVMIAAVVVIPLLGSITSTHAQGTITISEFPIPTGSSQPNSITSGPDGNIWFTEASGNKIGKITPSGTITEYSVPTSNSNPLGITSGLDGNIWFTEYLGNYIGKITPSGTITEYSVPGSFGKPFGITSGPDGNLWFTLGNNYIGTITPSGTITEYTVPSSNSYPFSITSGPDGNLWFTEFDANQIGKITPSGTVTEYAVPTSNSGPTGITSGPDGNLWFTEGSNNNIGKITPSGTITEYAITTISSAPRGITTGPDGNIWFAEDFGNKIGTITPSGTITNEYAIPTSNSNPYNITAGPDGNIWFVEGSANQIGRVNLSSPTPSPSPSPSPTPTPRKVLFIDLQGINTSLSAAQASARNGDGYSPAFFDTVNNIPGISPYLMANGYQQARYVVYSYTGFTASGGPRAYTCLNTFTNPLLVDARLLAKQIAALADSNTDVYLIGHSLGGVIAYTYLVGYVEHLGNLAPLPQGAAIKGVITGDSPVGGISDNKDYNDFLASFYSAQCKGLTARTMVSVLNLRQIFKTATDSNHLGATVSIVKAIFKGNAITNQAVADAAKSQSIAVLTIKNVNDLLWRPSVCNTLLGTKMTDFPSTQALTDEGSLVYGRQFTSGTVDCRTLLSGGNHGVVLHFADVDTALTQFLPNGGVPSALTVAP